MNAHLDTMCDWERKKAVYLLHLAETLGMNTSGYGELTVNPNSGHTYLWLEEYDFTLYLPITCELQKSDVLALWTNPNDGEEREIELAESTTLEDLERWAQKQAAQENEVSQ